ncbi:amidohydrolase family protein [Verticiella sediminum]|uniref:Amidohydrolase family protein n=1 Tax=Verticiella sediminum TaxID=1247510 RepID=A0A556AWP6_9BURK|nr:amidohydrolase family protein [Verticiella sediminum]TSH97369.1 amidohydrolase family protein [Verticiella sediminum]
MTDPIFSPDPAAKDFPPPHIAVRPDWLDRAVEPVIEPELRILDAHHHLWNRPSERYVLPDLLADLASGHRVDATVYVQCRSMYRLDGPVELRPVGETEHLLRVVERLGPDEPRVAAGIVCMADLMLGDGVVPVLEAQIEAGQGRVRGVRTMTSSDPSVQSSFGGVPAHRLLDPQWRKGAAHLPALGLTCDVYVFHTQLDDVASLARAHPELTIVLNHMGTPLGSGAFAGRRQEVFGAWSAAMGRVAECPNVVVKLGGAGMHTFGFGFHEASEPPDSAHLAEAFRPYVHTCIELFGAQRCMFESNFPVDKGQFGYRTLWNAFKRLAGAASTHEKQALFAGTAARVYRIAF